MSFAFDSLLKLDIGIRIHLGILLIFILNLGHFVLKGWQRKITLLRIDTWLILFTIYILVAGLIKVGTSSLFIFFYFFLALNIYFFIRKHYDYFELKIFIRFQWILIITGLLQFLLYLIFGYQLNFLGVEHYSESSSVALRLRGFFVEPNWYAIAITFNTFLLIGRNLPKFVKSRTILFCFTLLVLLLNGTFGTLIILVGTYGYRYLKKNVLIATFLLLIGLVVFNAMLSKRAEVKKGRKGIELFNYYSRTEPLKRVYKYMSSKPLETKLFGEGLGSWGTKAIENRLSVLVYNINPKSRDGSELPVFIFELGIIGTLLFFLDLLVLYFKNGRKEFHIQGALLLFLASFLLYPIFKFFMYMVYYFIIRQMILENNKEKTINLE
ncbi:hypothetical protein [Aquimarina sp. BL5]|uniref:hypothetical protein n=1 Tax=Aquimarina sp. BL5 TaxID=1714860 RepID=UPI0011C3D9C6|nr:hypothetical protein [Aquimarina sp. BL5]